MTSEPPSEGTALRVLILAPTGRDAELTRELLMREGHVAEVCSDVEALVDGLHAGAGTLLITEEALSPAAQKQLVAALSDQAPWSDLPVIIFSKATRDEAAHAACLGELGNVTILDRPVHVRTMLAAVNTALRSRRRQYDARKAIESRDRFLAMLGHELRNPLGSVRLAVELLSRTDDPGRREKHLGVLDRQTRHLARLVDDLLDVARITHGKVSLKSSPLDLVEVVRGSIQAVEPLARGQRIEFERPRVGPIIVQGDLVRLEQVFGNLLTNAIKYTPPDGKVTVAVAPQGDMATVRIRDTGVGIEPSLLDAVFDVFTQADRSLDRSKGGLGLGLAVVRSLVALHRGSVRAHSAGLGHGTEFVVELPLASSELQPRIEQASGRAHTQATEPRAPSGSRRVVVVEDNEDIRGSLRELLEVAGHHVATASDGPEGLATILAVSPDVALIDIGLPGFDGYEVARRVRAAGKRDVKLVALTGYGQREDRERAASAGFDRHVTKPAEYEDLRSALN